jgi:GNAT superfamily N-acetyltransferase
MEGNSVWFSLRDATLADMEALQSVFQRASLSNENDREALLANPQWLALSETGVREGRMRAAVDERDAVLGFATYLVTDGVAELEDLFVDPPQMRRRIGEALVRDISDRVRALGFETLEVTANPHAMAFYEHMGFMAGRLVDTEFYPAPRMRRPTA